ncbi:MAG: FAD-dependent monooxygenase [Flavobacteriales bacterium]|nr:FAD-dependent monooxygenase [Flavobacteriales bacterium]
MEQRHFTILGGGIAGLTTAIALERSGMSVSVFEAAPEMRPIGAGLGLAANAISALDALGLKERTCAVARELHGLAILDERGRTITRMERPAGTGSEQYSIHRADLQSILLAELRSTPIQLGKRAVSVSQDGSGVTVHFADGSVHRAEHLIIADGVRSASRAFLLPHVKPRYAGYTCWRGVVHAPDLRVEQATETWGRKGRFGIVPLSGDRIYWFATVNSSGQNERHRDFRIHDLVLHFADYHAPITDILARTTDEELLWDDIHDLAPLARFAFDRILLIGDAAHATTPNMGQGACQAIEDAAVLAGILRGGSDVVSAFERFQEVRWPRTKWVTDSSWRLGRIAQWEDPLAIRLRNGLFRMLPASINEASMRHLADVQFDPVPEKDGYTRMITE